jgi:hypothetical protein
VPRAKITSISLHFGAAAATGVPSMVAVMTTAIVDAMTARRTHRVVMPTDTVFLLDLESSY